MSSETFEIKLPKFSADAKDYLLGRDEFTNYVNSHRYARALDLERPINLQDSTTTLQSIMGFGFTMDEYDAAMSVW